MSHEDEVRQLRDLRKKFEDRMPQTVYHYTSAESFRRIVTSSELWLTNAAFVNDTTECKAFLEDCAKHLLNDAGLANEAVKDILRLRLKDCPENDNYYVTSFSKEGNSLPQYRAYGSVCIGFDTHRMNRSPFNLYECVYAEEDMRRWVFEKSTISDWSNLRGEDRRYGASDLLFAAQVKYKNASYQNEQEVRMLAASYHTWDQNGYVKALFIASAPDILRFLHADDPPIHFRDHPSYRTPILPYVKFFISAEESAKDSQGDAGKETVTQIKKRRLKAEEAMSRELLPITEVWIGPMARQEEVTLASEIMLREKGYENVPVIASQIPYRGV